jgi:alanyl-tRNA synthetase
LYDSFGFPLELTQEMAEQQGIQVTFPACSWEKRCHWMGYE